MQHSYYDGSHFAYMMSQPPPPPPLPPPPPPPRGSGTGGFMVGQHRRTSSCDERSLNNHLQINDAGRGRSISHVSHAGSEDESITQGCIGCTKDPHETILKLEGKLLNEIVRTKQEAQANQQALILELEKVKTHCDICWSNVAELKEQNHLLRLRNFELEAQNIQFNTQLSALKDQLMALRETDVSHLKGGNFCSVVSAISQKVPKLPNSGSDIW